MPEAQVNVGAAATQLVPDHAEHVTVRVRNTGANPVDLGGPDVVFGSGFTVAAGAEEQYDLVAGERLFGICGAGLNSVCDVSW